MSNVKCQRSMKFNFCRSVPPELLRSFFAFAIQQFSCLPVESRYFLSYGRNRIPTFQAVIKRKVPYHPSFFLQNTKTEYNYKYKYRIVSFQAVIDGRVWYHLNCFPNTMQVLPSKATFFQSVQLGKLVFVQPETLLLPPIKCLVKSFPLLQSFYLMQRVFI